MEAIFFPRKDYNVEVCNHRFGKSMTYTEDTDQFRGGAEQIAAIAETNGVKFSVFWGTSGNSTDAITLKTYLDKGKAWVDAYLHPYNASSGESIPQTDYEAERDKLLPIIKRLFNVRPVAASYNSGNFTYCDYVIEDFIGARKSEINGGTPYGVGLGNPNDIPYSKAFFKAKASSSRWFDDAKSDRSFSTRLATLVSDVQTTKLNGGWYNNFTHWHQILEGTTAEVEEQVAAYTNYFQELATLNQNNDIYFAGYGEAIAYLAYRQMITRAVMYSPVNNANELVIVLETDNTTLQVDTNLLVVPISIKFSTTGTPLEGQNIKSDRNLISLGSNQYIIEIPFGRFPIAKIEKD